MSTLVAAMRLAQQQPTVTVVASDGTWPEVRLREEAVEEAVERALSSPEFAAQVTTDIRNLAQTVKDIRAGFRAVADDLVGFDNEEYKDKDGEVLRLRPRWVGYQEVSCIFDLESLRSPVADHEIDARRSMIYWRRATAMRLRRRL